MPIHLRKRHAGGDSYGNVWPHDGAVIPVDDEQAAVLLAIPDAGITVAEAPAPTPVTEPAPAPVAAVTEPAPSPRPRPRKARTPRPVAVEE